jgi:hypothetical protein
MTGEPGRRKDGESAAPGKASGRTVQRLPGETDDEYQARLLRDPAPLSAEAVIEIREAADWYWAEREREKQERQAQVRRQRRRYARPEE